MEEDTIATVNAFNKIVKALDEGIISIVCESHSVGKDLIVNNIQDVLAHIDEVNSLKHSLEQLKQKERKIGIQLLDIVVNYDACTELGFNPYCVAEGADGDELIQVNYEDAKKWGLI